MSMQLVLAVNTSADGKTLADWFRWCWLGSDGNPQPETAASGDREALREALVERAGGSQSTWLILPGNSVGTRELEYSEKEKKHLRNLLPFQLEESVIGDVEDLHFALGSPADGRVVVAYTDKTWLQAVFAELAALGIEVTRCWSAPLILPRAEEALSDAYNHWSLGLYEGQFYLRYAPTLGFSLAVPHARMALSLLLTSQERVDRLPDLHLRAATEEDLAKLTELVPAELQGSIKDQVLADAWSLDYGSSAIDICQGEFSQRLPIERWWKMWKTVAIFAGVCAAVYLGVLIFEIQKLSNENLKIRQQIETAARAAIPQGRMVDPEKQLTTALNQLQPTDRSGRVMELLVVVLPQVSSVPNVSIKGIAYVGEIGELNINVQADSFATFETIAQNIRTQGFNAEVLSANAQGNVQTARLKITKNPQ
ncbi:MAG: general secretion pathway protein GspL [Cellvibrio sp. 79]|nr:MAG: general secretion pathway protein GspL [Cellvibrio sp. 79]